MRQVKTDHILNKQNLICHNIRGKRGALSRHCVNVFSVYYNTTYGKYEAVGLRNDPSREQTAKELI